MAGKYEYLKEWTDRQLAAALRIKMIRASKESREAIETEIQRRAEEAGR